MNRARLVDSIKRHEGYRRTPYLDHLGTLTVGYGHNIHGLAVPDVRTMGELFAWLRDPVLHEAWLGEDTDRAIRGARAFAGDAWDRLSDPQRETLAEMSFQLGPTGLGRFKRFRAAILRGDDADARAEMADSLWAARQTPERAAHLIAKFR